MKNHASGKRKKKRWTSENGIAHYWKSLEKSTNVWKVFKYIIFLSKNTKFSERSGISIFFMFSEFQFIHAFEKVMMPFSHRLKFRNDWFGKRKKEKPINLCSFQKPFFVKYPRHISCVCVCHVIFNHFKKFNSLSSFVWIGWFISICVCRLPFWIEQKPINYPRERDVKNWKVIDNQQFFRGRNLRAMKTNNERKLSESPTSLDCQTWRGRERERKNKM